MPSPEVTLSKVTVVIVAYGSHDVLPGAIEALPSSVEIVLVEQSASARSAHVALEHFSDRRLRVVYAGANRGFGAGCNLGAANATGEIVVFLNPDARIDAESLISLARAVERNGGSVAGPVIRDSDGQHDTRVRQWTSPWHDVAYLVLPRPLFPRRLWKEIPPEAGIYRTGGAVDFVQGSCFAVARSVFFAVGGFNERLFLYGEEEWLALRLKERGLRETLELRATATHEGKTSTDKVGTFALRQMYRSQALIYRLRFGRVKGALAAGVLGAGITGLLLTTPFRRVIRFRPVEDAAWCLTALGGLSDGVLGRGVEPPAETVEPGVHWVQGARPEAR